MNLYVGIFKLLHTCLKKLVKLTKPLSTGDQRLIILSNMILKFFQYTIYSIIKSIEQY